MEFPTDRELFPNLDTVYGVELIKKFDQIRDKHVKKVKEDAEAGKLMFKYRVGSTVEEINDLEKVHWNIKMSSVASDIGRDWENLLVDELVREQGKNADGFPIVPSKMGDSDLISFKVDDSAYFFYQLLKDINVADTADRDREIFQLTEHPTKIFYLWQPMFYAIYKAGKGELIKRLFQLLLCIVIVAAVLAPGYWYMITQPGATGEFPKFLIILALIVLTPIGISKIIYWVRAFWNKLHYHLAFPRRQKEAIRRARPQVQDAYRVLRFLTLWAEELPHRKPADITDKRFKRETDAAENVVARMQKCFDKYVEMYVNN